MTDSSAERKIRAALPVIRLMQTCVPLSLAHWLLKRGMARVRLDGDVTRETIDAGAVPCEWLVPRESRSDQALLYLHGGGFVFGMTPQHLRMGAYLAKAMGVRVLMVDYRTAPEFPFPAALDDSVSAYRWLRERGFAARDIVIAGDSAGGNLTLSTLMRLRDGGHALPAAAACLSPAADLTPRESLRERFRDPLLSPRAVKFYNRSYLGGRDPRDPLISPVFGDLRGLPPLLVHAGEDEILRDDALRITSLARAAGVDARLEVYPRMWHVWQLNLTLPQAIRSLDEIGRFLRAHLVADRA